VDLIGDLDIRDGEPAAAPPGLAWEEMHAPGLFEGAFAHGWLTLAGRHFDAEVPEGVDHPFDLPTLRRGAAEYMARFHPERYVELLARHAWWRESDREYRVFDAWHAQSTAAIVVSPVMLEALRDIRTRIRESEVGGTGVCQRVSQYLEARFGWACERGVYLAADGEPIACHLWNRLPDGGLIDATADQFGEGADVLLVAPDNAPLLTRFRAEWSEDCNPGLSGLYPELKEVEWTGEYDLERMERVRRERRERWWLAPAYCSRPEKAPSSGDPQP
jgi:hypothetical protein